MNAVTCRSCGSHLSANSVFCEDCGVPVDANLADAVKQRPTELSSTLANFFASQSTLCLFTLLVFLGLVVALAPAGWRYAGQQLAASRPAAPITSATRSLGVNNSPARCNQIVVIFNAAATVSRVSALLDQLDTTIAFGPNENGAFELSVPATAAVNVANALNRAADVVVTASLQQRCL